MQKPELLATGHMRDHVEHSWVCVIDWELFACNLCNNQDIRTPFQDAALSSSTSVYLHCEKLFTCSLIFLSFKYSRVSFPSHNFYTVDIFSIYK